MPPLPTRLFIADATKVGSLAKNLSQPVDLVFTDLPYGQLSVWQGEAKNHNAVWHLLAELHSILHPKSVVAVATSKNTVVSHEKFEGYGRFRHGKRLITFLKPVPR